MEISDSEHFRQKRIERLKSNPMGDAFGQADTVLAAASDEIMGMLYTEGREHLDEKQEEEQEKAKEAADKKEELEETLEARKSEREEQEELTQDILEASAQKSLDADSIAQAQQEVKDLVQRLKLIEDDVKGASVDQGI